MLKYIHINLKKYMWLNRDEIEKRIFSILTYIDGGTLAFPLKQNISLFSTKELEQMLDFLETWNLEPIYNFLDEKYKEYLAIIEEIKMLKIWEKKKIILQEEEEERISEYNEIELLLKF